MRMSRRKNETRHGNLQQRVSEYMGRLVLREGAGKRKARTTGFTFTAADLGFTATGFLATGLGLAAMTFSGAALGAALGAVD
jgi:hypothetical protein